MKIDAFYSPDVVFATLSDTLSEVARRMHDHGIGGLPVTDDDVLVGMITERDLVRALAYGADPKVTPVAEYVSLHIATATPDEDSAPVARRMLDGGIRHLPVTRGEDVVGIISLRDLSALEAWWG